MPISGPITVAGGGYCSLSSPGSLFTTRVNGEQDVPHPWKRVSMNWFPVTEGVRGRAGQEYMTVDVHTNWFAFTSVYCACVLKDLGLVNVYIFSPFVCTLKITMGNICYLPMIYFSSKPLFYICFPIWILQQPYHYCHCIDQDTEFQRSWLAQGYTESNVCYKRIYPTYC